MSNRPNFYHDVPVWLAKFLSKCTCLTGQISIMMYLMGPISIMMYMSDRPNFYDDIPVCQAQFLSWYTCPTTPISIIMYLPDRPNLYRMLLQFFVNSVSQKADAAVLLRQATQLSPTDEYAKVLIWKNRRMVPPGKYITICTGSWLLQAFYFFLLTLASSNLSK